MRKVLVLVSVLCFCTAVMAKKDLVTRVEPAEWWAGMAHEELQLMLYGEDIAEAEVRFEDDALRIDRIERTDNPDYMFLYVDVKDAAAGDYKLMVKKGGKRQAIAYRLNSRREGSALRRSFGTEDAIYLIMPDRFANGNRENDSVEGYHEGVVPGDLKKRQGGDIEGIIRHLDYIADLGMTAVWTTPMLEDNDLSMSYHHYACTDYYKVDPRFGTNRDYRRLADECHLRGLKLIIDIVPNHCGWQHWWHNDLPAKDWYNQWEAFTRTNYNTTVWTDPHRSDYDMKLLRDGWFDTNMPDMNLNNPLVFDYVRQAYTYWIEYADIDGVRVDTYPYNDIHTAARLMNALNREYPNLTIVGECWVKSVTEMAYYQTGANNRDGFDSGLQSVMDFTMKDYFDCVFKEPEAWNTGVIRFYNHMALDFAIPNPDMVMNMLDNHDMSRFAAEVNYDKRLYKMGLALVSTLRGYPQFYYGDEIMQISPKGGYENCRHNMMGGWEGDPRSVFTREGRTADENEIYDYLSALLNFRKACPAFHTGSKMKQFIPRDGIYAFFRYQGDAKVMVVTNNNEEERVLQTAPFAEMEIEGHTVRCVTSGEKFVMGKELRVPGKTVLVLEIM